MAATVPVEKAGDVNPLLESAQKIGDPPTTEEQEAAQAKASGEPQPGSFERFMATFGNPGRWAGRS